MNIAPLKGYAPYHNGSHNLENRRQRNAVKLTIPQGRWLGLICRRRTPFVVSGRADCWCVGDRVLDVEAATPKGGLHRQFLGEPRGSGVGNSSWLCG